MALEILIYTYTCEESVKRLHAIYCKAYLSVNIVKKMIFWKHYVQACNQLGKSEVRFWQGSKFFELCPIVLNYVQHIFQGTT